MPGIASKGPAVEIASCFAVRIAPPIFVYEFVVVSINGHNMTGCVPLVVGIHPPLVLRLQGILSKSGSGGWTRWRGERNNDGLAGY